MGRMKEIYEDFMLLDSGILSFKEFKNKYSSVRVSVLNELRKDFNKLVNKNKGEEL